MKFYLAGKLTNREAISQIVESLKRAGHTPSYDWTTHGSMQHDPGAWPKTADRELGGVQNADVVIVFLPAGRGTHVELGMALMIRKLTHHTFKQKRIIIVGTDAQLVEGYDYNCVFHFHDYIERFETVNELVESSGLFT